jgi:hypothetical protein
MKHLLLIIINKKKNEYIYLIDKIIVYQNMNYFTKKRREITVEFKKR